MDDKHQHQDSELCAPFCHCQSCAVYATFFKVVDFSIETSTISSQEFYSIDGLEKDFYATILQPPQA
ncbi:MAG: hypothetical protein CSA40_00790 [Flavobacteriales bacterium]|nr:MAG: hypothetical protein CSA40_00790 [Flavobacteriales bacterium]